MKSQKMVAKKNGVALEGDAANLAHLREQFDEFTETALPILRRLGVI